MTPFQRDIFHGEKNGSSVNSWSIGFQTKTKQLHFASLSILYDNFNPLK